MLDIEKYIEQLINLLTKKFNSRLVYLGLQGSYLRGEATADSDIDIMVVIDNLSVSDLDTYRAVIHYLGHFEKSCGFICSKADLKNWNPLEICHLLHSTKDYFGVLSTLTPVYTDQDIQNFVKISINNLYHEICHRYIHAHEKHDIEHLSGVYKGVFFILQNLYYLTHKKYITTKVELLQCLDGMDHAVLLRSMELNQGITHDIAESFALLFTWCQKTLVDISEFA